MSGLAQLFAQLGAFWNGLTGAQRVAFLSTVLITGGVFSLIMRFGYEPEYATLYANLAPEDAATIVDELSTQQIPFKLSHAGTAIHVPVERVYDMRLELAAKGLPAAGPVGFEIFNETELGMTPFQQRITFRRALEGELVRTISRLGPVQSARVHITIPEKTVFQRDRQKPRAAVVVSLLPGRTLSPSETSGITQLMAGSVEGLESGQVTIVDSSGRLLARPGSDEGDILAAEVLDVQRAIERKLANRTQSLLDAAVGAGRSVVTVTAEITRNRFEEKKERVNPDEAAVVSEQRTEETRSEPSSQFGGIPGTPSNVPGGRGADSASGDASTENVTRETINFEVSRSASTTVIPMGEIQNLSIAVLVDGTYTLPEGAIPGEIPTYAPRSEEELGKITDIVKRAVGFSDERGDIIEVQNLQFRSPLDDMPLEEISFLQRPEIIDLIPTIIRVFAVLVGVLLLGLLVIRPILGQLSTAQVVAIGGGPVRAGAVAPDGVPYVEKTMEQKELEIKAAELAIPISKDQAKDVAAAMKQWLRE